MKNNKYLLIIMLMLSTNMLFAQISGTVFRDNNIDGVYQPLSPNFEKGLQGITINAYDASNTIIATTTSAFDGTYSLPFTVPVRLEFEFNVSTPCLDSSVEFSTTMQAGENIRFVSASTNNVDFGLQNPEDYQVTADPKVFITKFNDGDPLQNGTAGTVNAFFGFPYSSNTYNPTDSAFASQLGSVWGVAYSNQAKKVFTSAFLKRQSGLGPLGSGGIYILEPNGGNFIVNPFYDMDANGHRTRALSNALPYGNGSSFNFIGSNIFYLGNIDQLSGLPEGLGVIGVNGINDRDLLPNWQYQQFRHFDTAAIDQVGKVSLGDMDISEDGKFLFVTNLYSRLIFRLELDNAFNPQTVIAVDSFALPNIIVNNGVLRPFALAYHRGKLFIGAVTTGENGGQNIINGATDLYAYVFEMKKPISINPFISNIPIITFPLNYLKGIGVYDFTNKWNIWENRWLDGVPILSDLEFTDNNDLIMDFFDRLGHQVNSRSISGDILIAGFNCTNGNYFLENNGSYLSSNGIIYNGGVGNNQGPGGGEFFFNENYGNNIGHCETSVGSCAVLKGKNEVIVSLMDAVGSNSNGTAKFSTINAAESDSIDFAGAKIEFGKANSLGDIEIAGDACPLQLGNRVWIDANENGIQDPLEQGINNVAIDLFADFNNDSIPDGTTLGTAISNFNGIFVFDKNNVLDGDPVSPNIQAGPVHLRNYIMRIAPSNWNNGIGTGSLSGFISTTFDVGGNGQADVRDNDALLIDTIPTIFIAQKRSGENSFKYDFGFVPCKVIAPTSDSINCIIKSVAIGITPITNHYYTWSPPIGLSNVNSSQTIASPSVSTIYTLTENKICTSKYIVSVDTSLPKVEAGISKNLDCNNLQSIIGSPAIFGYSYHWSPGSSLNDSTIAQPTATPQNTTVYTLTIIGTNGCENTDEVKLNIDKCCSKIVLPNSFSPNEDNVNDKFGVILIQNVKDFYISIYNRWGEKVFESDDPKFKWNGKDNHKYSDLDTYFYYIKYNCENDSKLKMIKGDVTLIR